MGRLNIYPKVGQPEVLQSAAGWYIGRLYYYSDEEFNPYDRISGYYATREQAQDALITKDHIDIRL